MLMLQVQVIVEEELPTSVDKDLLREINLKNYPNPVVGQTTFAFNVLQPSEVMIQVFNTNGVLEKIINFGTLGAGQFKQNVDLSLLPTGIHIYTLSINGSVKVYNKLMKR